MIILCISRSSSTPFTPRCQSLPHLPALIQCYCPSFIFPISYRPKQRHKPPEHAYSAFIESGTSKSDGHPANLCEWMINQVSWLHWFLLAFLTRFCSPSASTNTATAASITLPSLIPFRLAIRLIAFAVRGCTMRLKGMRRSCGFSLVISLCLIALQRKDKPARCPVL